MFVLLVALGGVVIAAPAKDEAAEKVLAAARAAPDRAALEAQLVEIDKAIAANAKVSERHQVRAMILSALNHKPEALVAYQKAFELDPKNVDAAYNIGVLLADAGKEDEAAAAWERAVAAVPNEAVDAYYNLGQYYYNKKQFDKALARWQAAHKLAAGDFDILKKVVQTHYALGKVADGEHAQVELVALWKASTDPTTKKLTEYVYDQFEVGATKVMAVMPLVASKDSVEIVTFFRVVDDKGKATGVVIAVEQSEVSKRSPTPYVLSITRSGKYSVVGGFPKKPTHAELKAAVAKLLGP